MLAFDIPKPWEGTISRTQGSQNPMLVESKAARIIQAGQVFVQNNAIEPNLAGDLSPIRVPKIVGRGPLQFIPPIIVGRGFRPEHVRTPDVHAARPASSPPMSAPD